MTNTAASATLARFQAGAAPAAKAAAGRPADDKQADATGVRHETVRRVAQEFEALFLSEMLRPVFENMDTDGLFGGGEGERVFRSLMVQEYGKAVAQSGGIGIADAVQREILKMQENQQ